MAKHVLFISHSIEKIENKLYFISLVGIRGVHVSIKNQNEMKKKKKCFIIIIEAIRLLSLRVNGKYCGISRSIISNDIGAF